MTRTAGIVLAAGAGRRLRPITDAWPKPLTPVLGRPLIDRAISALYRVGVERILVNTYTEANLIEQYLRVNWPEVHFRRELALSGPAGTLRCFQDVLTSFDQVLIVSGDVIFDASLDELLSEHILREASLTFGVTTVKQADRFGVLDIGDDGTLVGAREKPDVSPELDFAVSTGIYAIHPSVIDSLPADGISDFIPDLVPALRAQGRTIVTHPLSGYWFDVGTPVAFRDALAHLLAAGPSAQFIDKDAMISPDASLRGWVVVERDARVGSGAWVQDSVLLPGANVQAGAYVIGGIVGSRSTLSDEIEG